MIVDLPHPLSPTKALEVNSFIFIFKSLNK